MKTNFIFLIAVMLFFQNCGSFKKEIIDTGYKNEAINNAILDFSNTSKTYKKSNVFSVDAMELVENDKLLVVRIGENGSKFLLNLNTKVGDKGILPSKYVEKNGKLFFWWDNDYPLTEEMLAVLNKYNLLQDNRDGWLKSPDFKVDDSQKAAHYYFCRNHLSIYKKIITSIGIGYYDAPNLDCGS